MLLREKNRISELREAIARQDVETIPDRDIIAAEAIQYDIAEIVVMALYYTAITERFSRDND